MLYRAIIGVIPMLFIALFATGAIPLSSVMPTSEYRSPSASKTEGDADKRVGPARTAEGRVSQGLGLLSEDHIATMEDNMLAVEEMHKAAKEFDEKQKFQAKYPGWQPKSGGGWGR